MKTVMAFHLRWSWALASWVVFVAGCGQQHPVDRMEALLERKLEVFCACPDDYAFSDAAECRAYYARELTGTEASCLRGVYESSSAELDPYFSCYSNADETYYECIAALGCNAASSRREACVDAYQSAIRSCPTLSNPVHIEVLACYG